LGDCLSSLRVVLVLLSSCMWMPRWIYPHQYLQYSYHSVLFKLSSWIVRICVIKCWGSSDCEVVAVIDLQVMNLILVVSSVSVSVLSHTMMKHE
jgi:hypothetical protein